ncbi:hypothetical protein SAMN05443667_10511 [Flavobacterium gillisiae]|uniref:Phosphoribosylpyrophosphate synthetase n=1 Tax=Flavobacterium gillisiae TaxID=150146 RepID=A0A1H4BNB1_9FLAO|nr:hypothetical protein [Flavobacterium gillisiae]SEA49665.1 hypothetical protein SAMN05443667_10511 [Flavobacterium gillisiae]
MKPIYHYSTVSEALDELKELDFTYDYNIYQDEIIKNPAEHQVKHVYRYEGNSDPGDSAIVYGITAASGKKGVFVSGYSANTDDEAAIVLAKLCIENSDNQCRT